MTTFYSIDQVAEVAYAAGFRGTGLEMAIAISKAEATSGQIDAVNKAGNSPPSRDRGLWQINDYFHKEVSDAQAFNPLECAKAAYRISSSGSNWNQWSTYKGGQYKKYLADAKNAAAKVTGSGGSAGTGSSTVTTTTTGTTRGQTIFPVSLLPPDPVNARSPGDLQIRGSSLSTLLGRFAANGGVELSASEIGTISVSILDPGLTILDQPWLQKLAPATWIDWRLEISSIDLETIEGIPAITIGFWPAGVADMKKTPAKAFSNMTAGEWASRLFGSHGIFLENYEGKAEVGSFGPSTDTAGTSETEWEAVKRVANEKGCVFWVTPECRAIWGKPTIIAQAMARYDVGWNRSVPGDVTGVFDAIEMPKGHAIVNSSNPGTFDGDAVDVKLPRWRGERIRPGMGQSVVGIPKFGGRKMITKVSWKFDGGVSPVMVTAQDPVDPKVTKTTSSDPVPVPLGTSSSSGTASHGTKQAGDFVQFALNQAGDKYVFGATPKASDKDPTAFDCSSLVQWAAAQVGISMPRNSNEQYKVCIKKDIDTASRTRGALLFRSPGTLGKGDSGHVVISLGDGRTTIEAMGSAYGVKQGTIGTRFNQAGFIPGLVHVLNGGPQGGG